MSHYRKYTFITVAHQTDIVILCFQARSLAKYLPESLTAEIIVIDNGLTTSYSDLLAHYGHLAKIVRIIRAEDIAPSYIFKHTGWYTQQILKLLVCNHVKTDRYVMLDAKNIMVFPLKREFLENKLDEPRSFMVDYTEHSSRRWLVNSLAFYSLPDIFIKTFMPTTTPFVLVTNLVKEMIAWIEAREKLPFPTVFLDKKLTEFFLYAGYLIYTEQMIYEFTSHTNCHVVFDTTVRFSNSWVADTEKQQRPFFSVHRDAKLSDEAKRVVADFWKRRGLG